MVRPRRPITTAFHPISARFLHLKTYKTRVHVSPFVSPQLFCVLRRATLWGLPVGCPSALRDPSPRQSHRGVCFPRSQVAESPREQAVRAVVGRAGDESVWAAVRVEEMPRQRGAQGPRGVVGYV